MGVNQNIPHENIPQENINVQIDELVLTGFDRVDTDLLVHAFERELTRLLHRRGVAPNTWELDLVAGLPPLPRTTSARRLGAALARSVHSGLLRGGLPRGAL